RGKEVSRGNQGYADAERFVCPIARLGRWLAPLRSTTLQESSSISVRSSEVKKQKYLGGIDEDQLSRNGIIPDWLLGSRFLKRCCGAGERAYHKKSCYGGEAELLAARLLAEQGERLFLPWRGSAPYQLEVAQENL